MSGRFIARFTRSATFGMAFAVAGVALWMMPSAMAAQHKELPAGPNRELVYQRCQACHDLDNLYEAAGATRETWDGTLDLMVAFGLSVTPEQRAMILDYLATSMGPNPGNPGPAPQFAGRP
jgi:hypothetical protein